jgi:hypothetical protein
MFAHRSKIHMGSQVVAETPLMLPSFSSKGFPQIAKIMKLMGEFITGPRLVSAYDIYHKEITHKITFSELIFLDSGGYEAGMTTIYRKLTGSLTNRGPGIGVFTSLLSGTGHPNGRR